MSQVPRAGQMASWVGVCPGHNESAGKRNSGRTTKGNPWARRIFVECAGSGSRTKDSAAKARYEHRQPKIKPKRALVAVAHWMVLKVHEVLSTGQPYRVDSEPNLTASQARRLVRHHWRRLNQWLANGKPRQAAASRANWAAGVCFQSNADYADCGLYSTVRCRGEA